MVELNIYLSTPMEIVILLFWLASMAFVLRLAFIVVVNTPRSRRNRRQFRLPRFHVSSPRARTTRPNTRNANPKEWAELLSLLHNDVATANRLIDCERHRHPDRSLEWAVGKAVWQLKRDRH
jgi:hypothetical protein